MTRFLIGNELLPMTQNTSPPTKPYGTCRSEGVFTDPKNCAAYYVCRSGLSYHLSCAENMMFDPLSGKCEYSLGEKCRPGQIVQVSNSLRQYDDLLEYEAKDEGPKVSLVPK